MLPRESAVDWKFQFIGSIVATHLVWWFRSSLTLAARLSRELLNQNHTRIIGV
jgi:hypothetical protein